MVFAGITIRPAATSSRIERGIKQLALGDEFHLRGGLAGAGAFELRNRLRHQVSTASMNKRATKNPAVG